MSKRETLEKNYKLRVKGPYRAYPALSEGHWRYFIFRSKSPVSFDRRAPTRAWSGLFPYMARRAAYKGGKGVHRVSIGCSKSDDRTYTSTAAVRSLCVNVDSQRGPVSYLCY